MEVSAQAFKIGDVAIAAEYQAPVVLGTARVARIQSDIGVGHATRLDGRRVVRS
jgi:hypothetical protein